MESVEKFKKEMQARVDELRPYVEEYGQIEQLLKIMDSVKGKVVAYAEEAVPAFEAEKPKKKKRKSPTSKATRRLSNGDALKTRVGFVKKYLRDKGTSELAGTRTYDGEVCFTYGSLMNAMNKELYQGLTWNRKPDMVTARLIELEVIKLKHEVHGKQIRRYYAIGNIN